MSECQNCRAYAEEIEEIIAKKQRDARMALRFYKENRELKGDVVRLIRAMEQLRHLTSTRGEAIIDKAIVSCRKALEGGDE